MPIRSHRLRIVVALVLMLAAHRPAEAGESAPRRPELPPPIEGQAEANPIDRLLAAYLEEHAVAADQLVDDRLYARRVYLDSIGLLPTPEELAEFLADTRPEKRRLLVERLLSDQRGYAEHWLSFWNDALRNDYQGTGYIDGGRQPITDWLYAALAENKPYDQFVRELIDPVPGSEGFIKGIVWRGVVNASQTPEVQAAQNVSQVFLGLNLKCASCHDSFVNEWTLADAYGLANIFAEQPLEMHRCDRPTGEMAETRFLFPELGSVDASAGRDERLAQLAAIMTSPDNGRLARTMVNRVWARFMGRGLVEPVDEMDNEPWHADLLDWLAVDLADHGYDLKHTIALILTSRAYQLPAVDGRESMDQEFVFAGPLVRRMSAEQFIDAVSALTGVWQEASPAVLPPADEPGGDATDGDDEHSFVRFASGVINAGSLQIDVDISGADTLWLVVKQGDQGGTLDWADWGEPRLVGENGVKPLVELTWTRATSGYEQVQVNKNIVGKPLVIDGVEFQSGIGTHADSTIVYELPEGFSRFQATAGPDTGAVEQGPDGHEMQFLVMCDVAVRSSLVPADPLATGLGRPNRERVVTHRPAAATTLQALELTNGPTLDAMLNRGAQRWLAERPDQTQSLVEELYLTSLGRRPTDEEAAVAEQLVGTPASEQGIADLLWVLTMLPEFQLVY